MITVEIWSCSIIRTLCENWDTEEKARLLGTVHITYKIRRSCFMIAMTARKEMMSDPSPKVSQKEVRPVSNHSIATSAWTGNDVRT